MTRLIKQVFYGGIYLAVGIAICFGLYRLVVPAPSCVDGVRNGKEEGVDCGAVCGKSCPSPVQALQNLPIKLIANSDGSWDAIAHLENVNNAYGASRVDYVLRVTDATGATITNRREHTYVNPLQPRYLVFPLGALTAAPVSASLQFQPRDVQWQGLSVEGAGSVAFGVRSDTFTTASNSSRYEALVSNRSGFDFDTVDITVLLYNSAGTVVGGGSTIATTMRAGQSRGIVITWPFSIPGVTRTEASIGTNIFENDNFIKSYGSQERFQGF